MTPVRRRHVVTVAKVGAHTDGDGLLTDGEMERTRHLAGRVAGRQPLLAAADQQHPCVQPEQLVVRRHKFPLTGHGGIMARAPAPCSHRAGQETDRSHNLGL